MRERYAPGEPARLRARGEGTASRIGEAAAKPQKNFHIDKPTRHGIAIRYADRAANDKRQLTKISPIYSGDSLSTAQRVRAFIRFIAAR